LTSLLHTEHGQQIVQPADGDWVDTIQEAEESKRLTREKSSMCGFLNPKLNEMYERADGKLQALKELAGSRGLGTVLFSAVGVGACNGEASTGERGRRVAGGGIMR